MDNKNAANSIEFLSHTQTMFVNVHKDVYKVFSPVVLYAGMGIPKSPAGTNWGRVLKPVEESLVSNR